MKKIFLSVVLLMAAFIISHAQFSFGAKAGLNAYRFGGADGSDLESQKSRLSFHAGGFVNIPISEMFSVQPELLYSGQGTKQEEGDYSVLMNIDYLAVPVMLQYKNPGGFYAETGPEAGFLLSAKMKLKGDGDEETEDIKDEVKGFNLAWGIGAGYITKSGFGFGARYNLGLTNIAKDTDEEYKNNGFQVSLIYRFSAAIKKEKK